MEFGSEGCIRKYIMAMIQLNDDRGYVSVQCTLHSNAENIIYKKMNVSH